MYEPTYLSIYSGKKVLPLVVFFTSNDFDGAIMMGKENKQAKEKNRTTFHNKTLWYR